MRRLLGIALALFCLANAARGRHTLVVGPIGAGKSALLRAVARELPDALVLDAIRPLRMSLLGLCERLHARQPLVLPSGEAVPAGWAEGARRLARLNVRELTEIALANLAGRPAIPVRRGSATVASQSPVASTRRGKRRA